MNRQSVAAAAACGALFIASTARGQDDKRAEQLFLDGRAAVQAGDFATGCPKFEESVRLVDRAGTRLNLAECATHDNHLARAMDELDRAIKQLDAKDDRKAFAERKLADLGAQVARLTVTLAPSLPTGAEIELDGSVIQRAALDAPIRLDAGKHSLAARSGGAVIARASIDLAKGSSQTVTLGADAPVAAPVTTIATTKVEEAPTGMSGRKKAGLAIAGVGVAGFVVAGVTGGLLLSKQSDLERCGKACPAGTDVRATGLFVGNGIAWGVGIAGLVGGGALFFWPSGSASSAGIDLTPTGTGFALNGRF